MPKHDPPGDDAALLELERELMARIFTTPAAGLAGLAVQARAYLSEREVEFADSQGEGRSTSRTWAPCWPMAS